MCRPEEKDIGRGTLLHCEKVGKKGKGRIGSRARRERGETRQKMIGDMERKGKRGLMERR